ncbi:hypothetical protein [Aliikangiella maris]|uniref:DUF1240 domain-containing protein n=2 Tax=Aliikangiella maris TaxID=3162458 RepID=A0ABV2BXF1_9GAMM
MTTQKTQYVEVRTDIKAKLLAIGGILLTILFIAISGYFTIGGLVNSFERLSRGSYYLEVSVWDLPVLFLMPCLISLVYLTLLFLFNRMTQKAREQFWKVWIFFTGCFLVTRLFYGFWLSHYVESKGYHFCWYYSNVSMMTPNVYMNQPDLCYPVNPKSDILPWFDEQEAKGIVLTPDMVKAQADKISEAYEAQFRY